MYNIGTFSKLSNTSIQTLRYYDTLELLKPSEIGEYNNYRYYTNEELMKMRIIKKLKKMGLSLREIMIVLTAPDKNYFLKHKEKLQKDVNNNLKNIRDLEEIIKKMKNNKNLQKILVNLIKVEERKNNNMKENYGEAKEKFLKCYELYNGDNFEDCLVLLEELKKQIFDTENEVGDPFWSNSAGDLFYGIAIEVFKHNKINDVNFLNVFNCKINGEQHIDNLKDYIKTLDNESYSYLNLSTLSGAPKETSGSIVAVFRQSLKPYAMFDAKK
jgi:Predicted transcriptional regulators